MESLGNVAELAPRTAYPVLQHLALGMLGLLNILRIGPDGLIGGSLQARVGRRGPERVDDDLPLAAPRPSVGRTGSAVDRRTSTTVT